MIHIKLLLLIMDESRINSRRRSFGSQWCHMGWISYRYNHRHEEDYNELNIIIAHSNPLFFWLENEQRNDAGHTIPCHLIQSWMRKQQIYLTASINLSVDPTLSKKIRSLVSRFLHGDRFITRRIQKPRSNVDTCISGCFARTWL